MIQLIYSSTASPDLASGEIFRIVEKSATKNSAEGLSGFLLFFNERFFQVVEGPEAAIDALMLRLKADPRHHSINTIARTPIAAPSFAKWRMKRLFAAPHSGSIDQIDPALQNAPKSVQNALSEFLSMQSSLKAA